MADSITTNADLVTYRVLPEHEIDRLSDSQMRANRWLDLHKRAWRQTLKRLANWANGGLDEDDLDDTSELTELVCYHVAAQAYEWGPTDEDKAVSKRLFQAWAREIEEVEITSSGATLRPGAYRFQRRTLRG